MLNLPENHATDNTARKIEKATPAGCHLYRLQSQDGVNHTAYVVSVGKNDFVRVDDQFAKWGDIFAELSDGAWYVNCASVLSRDDSNEKQAKTALQFDSVLSAIYYGAPAQLASVAGHRIESCSHRTRDCSAFCLVSAGKGSMPSITFSRIARTRLSVFAADRFWQRWDRDQAKLQRTANRLGKTLHIRPNGTTDTMSAELQKRIDSDPSVVWYDYTAVPSRVDFAATRSNYSVTLSVKETERNNAWIRENVTGSKKHNAAIVVTKDVKAELTKRFPALVFDADKHDLRIPAADGNGGRLGLLTPKGKMRGKVSGTSMVFGSVERVLQAMGV